MNLSEKQDPEIRGEFITERARNTLKLGKILLAAGAPILAYFTYQDLFIIKSDAILCCRIFGFLIGILYAAFVFSRRILNPRLVVTVHSFFLAGIMVMISGSAFIVFTRQEFGILEKSAIVAGMLVVMFSLHLFSGGAQAWFAAYAGLPMAVLVLALLASGRLDTLNLTLLSNPIFAAFIISLVAAVHERMRYHDFVNRTLTLRQNEELGKLAVTDELTGLSNRRAGINLLHRMISESRYTNEPFTLAFLDADQLKKINDEYGHREGDNYLQIVAKTIDTTIRMGDSAARMGGDEFTVLFPGLSKAAAGEIIHEIEAGLEAASRYSPYPMSISYGIASFDPAAPVEARELLRDADSRMYLHKQKNMKTRGL